MVLYNVHATIDHIVPGFKICCR